MDDSPRASLHRLDMTSFKKRNSAILRDLEAQEVERDSLWAALQQARLDGERLRREEEAVKVDDSPLPAEAPDAPTSAELMAMLSPEAMGATPPVPPVPAPVPAPVPSRFAKPRQCTQIPDDELDHVPATGVIASGFICPTCWMRAPTAEVLRRHDEEVHQTSLERVTNKVLDNALGNMTRHTYRKIRRSMSMRPQNAPSPGETKLLAATRQAKFQPAEAHRSSRRYSLPPRQKDHEVKAPDVTETAQAQPSRASSCAPSHSRL